MAEQPAQQGGEKAQPHDDLLAILDDPAILEAKEFPLDAIKAEPSRVPSRFASNSNEPFRKRSHPMYSTSSAAFGAKDPQPTDLPTKYYGRTSYFTRTFKGGRAHESALNTFTTKSKVHAAYDGSL